jgi:hypothetical protein
MLSIILIAWLQAAPAPADEVVKGRLCIGASKAILTDGSCRTVTGTTLEVAAADTDRLFLWTSDDESTTQIGSVAAKATSVVLAGDDRRELRVTLAGDATREWPSDVRMQFRKAQTEWRWDVRSGSVRRLRRLHVPSGTYFVDATAAHHRPLRTRLQVTADKDLGEWRLVALPVARGRVVDAEGKNIGSATVALSDGKPCATANEQGVFICELAERLEEAIVVSAPGYGTREINFGRGAVDTNLGDIRLTKGQRITVKIRRDTEQVESLKVALLHDAAQKHEHSIVRTKTLGPTEEEVTFDDVGAGRYLVVLSGAQPLERLTVTANVKDENSVVEASIEPYRLEGSIRFGEEAANAASLEVIDREQGWRIDMPVNPDATFSTTAWAKGKVSGFVRFGEQSGMGQFLDSPELGENPSRWDIKIPNRKISGRVVDAETGAPVANAGMRLSIESGGGQSMSGVSVLPDASYSVLAAKAGVYHLTVSASDYMQKMVDLTVSSDDVSRTVDIKMERGVAVPMEIITAAGAPIPRAQILEGVMHDRVNPQLMAGSDEVGKFTLRGQPGQLRTLYVVPRDGSFAVVRVTIPQTGESAKPIQVVVPSVVGSIRVRTVDQAEKPVPAGVLLRFNGEFIPFAVRRFATTNSPGTLGEQLLDRLPAGTYELWGTASREDESAIIASNGTLRPPVRVGLSAGEQVVTVRVPKQELKK